MYSKNQTIAISDVEALNVSRLAKLGLKPLDYTVSRVQTLVHALATWIIVYLTAPLSAKGAVPDAVLLEQVIDGESQFFIYQDSGLPQLNRLQHLEEGHDFLFAEIPEGDLIPNVLKLVDNIIEKTDTGEEIKYRLIAEEFTGTVTESPKPSGLDNLIGTIAQYGEPKGERRAMLLEIGVADSDEGGIITLYTGRCLKLGEVKVY